MRQPSLSISVHHDVTNTSRYFRLKSIAQACVVGIPTVQLFCRKSGGRAESNNAGYVFRAAPPFAFLMTTYILWRQSDTSSHVERSCSLRRIKLMRRDRQKITA